MLPIGGEEGRTKFGKDAGQFMAHYTFAMGNDSNTKVTVSKIMSILGTSTPQNFRKALLKCLGEFLKFRLQPSMRYHHGRASKLSKLGD